ISRRSASARVTSSSGALASSASQHRQRRPGDLDDEPREPRDDVLEAERTLLGARRRGAADGALGMQVFAEPAEADGLLDAEHVVVRGEPLRQADEIADPRD